MIAGFHERGLAAPSRRDVSHRLTPTAYLHRERQPHFILVAGLNYINLSLVSLSPSSVQRMVLAVSGPLTV